MKTRILIATGIVFLTFAISSAFGQRSQGMRHSRFEDRIEARRMYKDLNSDQKERIDKIRQEQKESNEMDRKKMSELRERRQNIMREDKPDFEKVDKLIDEENAMRSKMMKSNVRRHNEIRSTLTPEQREKMKEHREKQRDRERIKEDCEHDSKRQLRNTKKEK